MNEIPLKSTSARNARFEARKYAPCKLTGYRRNKAVYLSMVRDSKDKAYVATASIPDKRPTHFTCTPIK